MTQLQKADESWFSWDAIKEKMGDIGEFIKEIDIGDIPLIGTAVNKFRDKVLAWYKDFTRLKEDKRELPPELEKMRSDLLKKGGTIEGLLKKLGTATEEDRENLGFIPVVWAGISAAAAGGVMIYIANWYSALAIYDKRAGLYTSAIKSGGSHDQAMRAMTGAGAAVPGVFGGKASDLKLTTKVILGVVVLGGLYMFFNRRG
jgi:hypothetical protein